MPIAVDRSTVLKISVAVATVVVFVVAILMPYHSPAAPSPAAPSPAAVTLSPSSPAAEATDVGVANPGDPAAAASDPAAAGPSRTSEISVEATGTTAAFSPFLSAACEAARAAGYAYVHTGDPAYVAGLDLDQNGITCDEVP